MQVLGILAAASLSVGLLLAPAAAPAVEPTGPGIANLTVDAGPFRVDGVARSAAAAISVDILDPEGEASCEDWPSPNVWLTRTAGGPAERVPVLVKRVSGTPEAGTYQGTWNIASTRSGVWTVTSVAWCRGYADTVSVDPRAGAGLLRTVTVVGTNLPRVTKVRVPAVAMWGSTQDVIVSFTTAAGRPLAYRTAYVADWASMDCGTPGAGSPRLTSGQGRLTVRFPGTRGDVCLRMRTDDDLAVLIDLTLARRERFTRVGALADRAFIPRSGTTAVRGSVAPSNTWGPGVVRVPGPTQVQLLRRDGARWTVVARASVRANGRYTILAPGTSAARGCHEYRVVASTIRSSTMVPTTSRTFVLTGR